MKLVSTFVSFLLSRLSRVVGSLRASIADWVPRPAPALVPIPIRSDRHVRLAAEHRRRRGL
ncbi:hypothetical protein [Piscinibacter sp.]|uniref:hypothetical protein n=1 Tax=Piscinibacter sp. TaxID=1903157 RepID=UPI0035AF2149